MAQCIENLNEPLRYGVQDMDGSAKRICKAALGAPEDHMVIILAHNGPTGLRVLKSNTIWLLQTNSHFMKM